MARIGLDRRPRSRRDQGACWRCRIGDNEREALDDLLINVSRKISDLTTDEGDGHQTFRERSAVIVTHQAADGLGRRGRGDNDSVDRDVLDTKGSWIERGVIGPQNLDVSQVGLRDRAGNRRHQLAERRRRVGG